MKYYIYPKGGNGNYIQNAINTLILNNELDDISAGGGIIRLPLLMIAS